MTGFTPSKGAVLNMIPAGGVVEFVHGDRTWSLPVVALGTVVADTFWEGDSERLETDTDIEPIVVDSSGQPVSISCYLTHAAGGIDWSWVPS